MRIYLDSIGCRLNQGEIEKYASQFRLAGHELVEDAAQADLVVVNTCAVTAEAASDSRQRIRQARRAGGARIAVTGCWSTLEPQAAAGLDGVQWVVMNAEKDALVAQVLNLPVEIFDVEPLARRPLPGLHLRTRAFIKAQDGCDNHCTYCVTRLARGSGRSQPVEEVLADVRAAVAGGVQEVVLSGVQLGSWGQDFEPRAALTDLVRRVLAETDVPRLRLSSVEPWDLDEDFFGLWRDPRLCRQLHLPLQSGSAAVLRRMARKTTPEAFAHLVALARSVSADLAITTDLIVGFPGETQAEFEESLAFVRSLDFAAGHVFTFSARPGTPAARLPGQVHGRLSKERSAILRAVFAEAAGRYQQRFIGQSLAVLWEAASAYGPQGWLLEGLTDNYLRVAATAAQPLWNQISNVRLERQMGDVLEGTIAAG